MDALADCELRFERLARAIDAAHEACDSAGSLPVSLVEAATLDAARMRLRAYEATERERLAPHAAAVTKGFEELHKALGTLLDAPVANVEAAILQLEAEEVELDARMVALYAEAAALSDAFDARINSTAIATCFQTESLQ
jgi:hypothetical protein